MSDETEAEKPAEKSIDELLGEFDEPKTEPVVQQPNRVDNVLKFVEDFETRQTQKDVDSGISDVVKFFKDEGIDSSDLVIEGYLNAYARQNPKVNEAFTQRHENPGAWKAIQKLAAEEMKSGLSTDTKISDAVTAAKASASGQTTEEPEPKTVSNIDLNALNDVQFAQFKRQKVAGATDEQALKSVK